MHVLFWFYVFCFIVVVSWVSLFFRSPFISHLFSRRHVFNLNIIETLTSKDEYQLPFLLQTIFSYILFFFFSVIFFLTSSRKKLFILIFFLQTALIHTHSLNLFPGIYLHFVPTTHIPLSSRRHRRLYHHHHHHHHPCYYYCRILYINYLRILFCICTLHCGGTFTKFVHDAQTPISTRTRSSTAISCLQLKQTGGFFIVTATAKLVEAARTNAWHECRVCVFCTVILVCLHSPE